MYYIYYTTVYERGAIKTTYVYPCVFAANLYIDLTRFARDIFMCVCVLIYTYIYVCVCVCKRRWRI